MADLLKKYSELLYELLQLAFPLELVLTAALATVDRHIASVAVLALAGSALERCV